MKDGVVLCYHFYSWVVFTSAWRRVCTRLLVWCYERLFTYILRGLICIQSVVYTWFGIIKGSRFFVVVAGIKRG